jgi:type IV secretion system protein VirD4
MTNAEIWQWLHWHQAHLPYIWGGLLAVGGGAYMFRRGWSRQDEDPDASWATLRGVRKVKLDGTHGLVIGQYGRYVLRYHGSGHVLVIARTRTGKSSAILGPTLLEPQPDKSLVVNDSKGELYRMTRRYQADVLGRRVYRLDMTSTTTDHFNPFDMVRLVLGTAYEGAALRVFSHMMANPSGAIAKDQNEAFWEGNTTDAMQALILYGLMTGRATNPAMFYEWLGTAVVGDLIVDLDGVGHQQCTSMATTLREMTESQQKSVMLGIRRAFAIYSDELLARMTATSDFRPEDLRTGPTPTTLYITAPWDDPELLNVNRLLLRQLLGSLARENPTPSATRRSMHGWDYDVDALVDEGPQLGKVDLFPALLDYSAGFGMRIIFVTPSLGRLEATYGRNNFLESTAVQIYFGIVDPSVAPMIATRLGTRAVVHERVSKGRGGTTRTRETVRKPLMDVSQVLDLDDSQLIVFADKEKLLVTQLPWYAYEPWKSRGDSLQ